MAELSAGYKVRLIGENWENYYGTSVGDVVTISGFNEVGWNHHFVTKAGKSVWFKRGVGFEYEILTGQTTAPDKEATFEEKVRRVTGDLSKLLISKNKSYGNSALDPVRIFAKSDTTEQLHVRIDDKLSRLKRGNSYGEDVIKDLMGYLVLLTIANEESK